MHRPARETASEGCFGAYLHSPRVPLRIEPVAEGERDGIAGDEHPGHDHLMGTGDWSGSRRPACSVLQLGDRGHGPSRRNDDRDERDGRRHAEGRSERDRARPGQGAVTDGLLDQTVREQRERKGGCQSHDEQRGVVQAGTGRRQVHVDGPVPQVDAVRDPPDGAQRREGEQRPENRRVPPSGGGDERSDGQPLDEEAAGVQPRRAVGDVRPEPAEVDEGEDPGAFESDEARGGARLSGPSPAGPRHEEGEDRAE